MFISRELPTSPSESLPPMAFISQNYFKRSPHANPEACQLKGELAYGALVPGAVI